MTVAQPEIPSDAAPSARPRRRRRGAGFARIGGLYLLALLILVFGIWIPDLFLTTQTVRTIASDQAVTLVLAFGCLVALSAGAFDLSVAQNLGFTAVLVSVLTVETGMGVAPAIAVTLLAGLTIGALNGVLVAYVGLDSFIATLGMTSVLLALTSIVSGSEFVGPVPDGLQSLTNGAPAGVPVLVAYCLVLAGVVWYLLERSPAGRRLLATGANREAAHLAGVATQRYVFWALMASGFVASVAGVLVASKVRTVSPDLGAPYLLPVFAACFLGTTQVLPGRFNVWGTVLAVVLLATGVKGLQLAGGQVWITDLFNGLALIGAVTIAVVAGKRRARESREQALEEHPSA